jgi:hypothetical protein
MQYILFPRQAKFSRAPGRRVPRNIWCNAKSARSDMTEAGARKGTIDTVHVCSLGQITQALFEVGGQYRPNMIGK